MHVAEDNFREQWNDHIEEMMSVLGGHARSIELLDPSGDHLTAGDIKSLDAERSMLRDVVNASRGDAPKVVYNGVKYVFLRKEEDKTLPRPFLVFVSLEAVKGAGKRGMLVTDYYGLVLVATFDNEKFANSVNAIVKYITPSDEDEE